MSLHIIEGVMKEIYLITYNDGTKASYSNLSKVTRGHGLNYHKLWRLFRKANKVVMGPTVSVAIESIEKIQLH